MSTLKTIIEGKPTSIQLFDNMVADKASEFDKYVQPKLDDFYGVQYVRTYDFCLAFAVSLIAFVDYILSPLDNMIIRSEIRRCEREKEKLEKEYIRRQIRSVCRYVKDFNDPSRNSLMERNTDNELIRESHTWNKVNHIRKYQVKGSSWNQMKTWLEQYDTVNKSTCGNDIINWILKTDV